MARIPRSGAAIYPIRLLRLRRIAKQMSAEYGVAFEYDENFCREISEQLGSIVGLHHLEAERPTVASVTAKLTTAEKAISVLEEIFVIERGGHIRLDPITQEVWSALALALASAPALSSREAAKRY